MFGVNYKITLFVYTVFAISVMAGEPGDVRLCCMSMVKFKGMRSICPDNNDAFRLSSSIGRSKNGRLEVLNTWVVKCYLNLSDKVSGKEWEIEILKNNKRIYFEKLKAEDNIVEYPDNLCQNDDISEGEYVVKYRSTDGKHEGESSVFVAKIDYCKSYYSIQTAGNVSIEFDSGGYSLSEHNISLGKKRDATKKTKSVMYSDSCLYFTKSTPRMKNLSHGIIQNATSCRIKSKAISDDSIYLVNEEGVIRKASEKEINMIRLMYTDILYVKKIEYGNEKIKGLPAVDSRQKDKYVYQGNVVSFGSEYTMEDSPGLAKGKFKQYSELKGISPFVDSRERICVEYIDQDKNIYKVLTKVNLDIDSYRMNENFVNWLMVVNNATKQRDLVKQGGWEIDIIGKKRKLKSENVTPYGVPTKYSAPSGITADELCRKQAEFTWEAMK